MSRAVVLGAGPVGLASAMLLAGRGFEVTVVDRDEDPPSLRPDDAWSGWARRSVPQFHQPNNFLPGGFQLLRQHLPDVVDALAANGGLHYDFLQPPPLLAATWERHDGDQRFKTINARRPVFELSFLESAQQTPGIEIRRGTAINELVVGRSVIPGVPHITGVRTASGEIVRGDVVLDVTGRNSSLPSRLAAVHAGPVGEHREPNAFAYYTRYYRGDLTPEARAPVASPMGSFSVLTLPADNGTWSVTVYGDAHDVELRAVRHPDVFDRVIHACPLHHHWLDGEPLTSVLTMASSLGRRRRFWSGDRCPLATGIVAVGDSWACTNPSLGRGITLGLRHAIAIANLAATHAGDPASLARGWAQMTEDDLGPWHDATLAVDRERLAEMAAERAGDPPPFDHSNPAHRFRRALMAAVGRDPVVLRGYLELMMCLALPDDVFTRPGFTERVLAVAQDRDPARIPGPDRRELLALVA